MNWDNWQQLGPRGTAIGAFLGYGRETSTTCASETQLIPRATTTLWIQGLLLVPSWPFSRYSSSPFLLFFPPPPHALSVPSISFLPYPSFTPAPCWRAEMGVGPSSCLQVGIVLFRVGKKKTSKRNWKASKWLATGKRPVWACQLWIQADMRQLVECPLPLTLAFHEKWEKCRAVSPFNRTHFLKLRFSFENGKGYTLLWCHQK